jgi:tricorn protease-like protein
MKKILFFGFFTLNAFAQNGTEIFLCEISAVSNRVILSDPQNITERAGYDNQPFFHPKKNLLYYSASTNDQNDIWVYDYKSKARSRVTNTLDSEYSPTVIPGERFLSCIVQRKSTGYQDLVKFDLSNPKKSEIILKSEEVGRVGYQAWASESSLITFILGDPHKLILRNLKAKTDSLIAKNIGRSLHKLPKENKFSFVQEQNNQYEVKTYDFKTRSFEAVAPSNADSEHFHVWTSNGVLLESHEKGIRFFKNETKTWEDVVLPSNLPKMKISRMAIKGKKIALVLEE